MIHAGVTPAFERRQSVRYEVDLGVTLRVFTGKTRVKTSRDQETRSINISQAGVCVICDEMTIDGIHLWGNAKLNRRNVVGMDIHFPWAGDDALFPIKGTVRYFEKIVFRQRECYRVFIEFLLRTEIDSIRVTRAMVKLEQYLSTLR